MELSGYEMASSTHAEREAIHLHVKQVNKAQSWQGFTLRATEISRFESRNTPRAATLVEVELSSKKVHYPFQVASLGIRQGKRFLIVESIYLDRLELVPGDPPIKAKLAVLNQDLNPNQNAEVVFAVPSNGPQGSTQRLAVSLGKLGTLPSARKEIRSTKSEVRK